MKYFGIFLIVALMAMVVVSLVRGIATFLASAKEDADRAPGDGPSPLQLRQNRLMFSRVKYQALAVLVIVVLMALSH